MPGSPSVKAYYRLLHDPWPWPGPMAQNGSSKLPSVQSQDLLHHSMDVLHNITLMVMWAEALVICGASAMHSYGTVPSHPLQFREHFFEYIEAKRGLSPSNALESNNFGSLPIPVLWHCQPELQQPKALIIIRSIALQSSPLLLNSSVNWPLLSPHDSGVSSTNVPLSPTVFVATYYSITMRYYDPVFYSQTMAVCVSLSVLSVLAVFLRVVARIKTRNPFKADDWWTYISLILFLAYVSANIWGKSTSLSSKLLSFSKVCLTRFIQWRWTRRSYIATTGSEKFIKSMHHGWNA